MDQHNASRPGAAHTGTPQTPVHSDHDGQHDGQHNHDHDKHSLDPLPHSALLAILTPVVAAFHQLPLRHSHASFAAQSLPLPAPSVLAWARLLSSIHALLAGPDLSRPSVDLAALLQLALDAVAPLAADLAVELVPPPSLPLSSLSSLAVHAPPHILLLVLVALLSSLLSTVCPPHSSLRVALALLSSSSDPASTHVAFRFTLHAPFAPPPPHLHLSDSLAPLNPFFAALNAVFLYQPSSSSSSSSSSPLPEWLLDAQFSPAAAPPSPPSPHSDDQLLSSLDGKSVLLLASEDSLFALNLVSSLVSWRMVLSHLPLLSESGESQSLSEAEPSSSPASSPRSSPPKSPQHQHQPSPTSSPAKDPQHPPPPPLDTSFVLIDDHIDTLRHHIITRCHTHHQQQQQLLLLQQQQQQQQNALSSYLNTPSNLKLHLPNSLLSKRPRVFNRAHTSPQQLPPQSPSHGVNSSNPSAPPSPSHHHRPPLSQQQLPLSPVQNPPRIIFFCSLRNYHPVHRVIQSLRQSISDHSFSSFSFPNITIVPKPVSYSRLTSAFRTAIDHSAHAGLDSTPNTPASSAVWQSDLQMTQFTSSDQQPPLFGTESEASDKLKRPPTSRSRASSSLASVPASTSASAASSAPASAMGSASTSPPLPLTSSRPSQNLQQRYSSQWIGSETSAIPPITNGPTVNNNNTNNTLSSTTAPPPHSHTSPVGTPNPKDAPSSPSNSNSQVETLEYFTRTTAEMGDSASQGIIIQSPDGRPAAIYFRPGSSSPRTSASGNDDYMAEKDHHHSRRRHHHRRESSHTSLHSRQDSHSRQASSSPTTITSRLRKKSRSRSVSEPVSLSTSHGAALETSAGPTEPVSDTLHPSSLMTTNTVPSSLNGHGLKMQRGDSGSSPQEDDRDGSSSHGTVFTTKNSNESNEDVTEVPENQKSSEEKRSSDDPKSSENRSPGDNQVRGSSNGSSALPPASSTNNSVEQKGAGVGTSSGQESTLFTATATTPLPLPDTPFSFSKSNENTPSPPPVSKSSGKPLMSARQPSLNEVQTANKSKNTNTSTSNSNSTSTMSNANANANTPKAPKSKGGDQNDDDDNDIEKTKSTAIMGSSDVAANKEKEESIKKDKTSTFDNASSTMNKQSPSSSGENKSTAGSGVSRTLPVSSSTDTVSTQADAPSSSSAGPKKGKSASGSVSAGTRNADSHEDIKEDTKADAKEATKEDTKEATNADAKEDTKEDTNGATEKSGKKPSPPPGGGASKAIAAAAAALRKQPKRNPHTVPPVRVLIVEDNRINQVILSTYLLKHNMGHGVASTGEQAVEMWKQGDYQLILMDIQLPGISGIEATMQIRAMEKERSKALAFYDGDNSTVPFIATPTTPKSTAPQPVIIVALTAGTHADDRMQALTAGCNDFVTKPVSLPWLQRKLFEWGAMAYLSRYRTEPVAVNENGSPSDNVAPSTESIETTKASAAAPPDVTTTTEGKEK